MNLWLMAAICWAGCLLLDIVETKHRHSLQLILAHGTLTLMSFANYMGIQ